MIFDLMPDHVRRHTEGGRKIVQLFVPDDVSWQGLPEEIRRHEELGGEGAVALLSFGARPRHEQRLVFGSRQVFEKCAAEREADGLLAT